MAFVKRLLYFLLLISKTFSIDSNGLRIDESDFEDDYLLPTIQIILLVNPVNKISILPYSLGSIESQLYPKHRIKVFIKTEELTESPEESITDAEENLLTRNKLTIDILRTWIRHNRHHYNEIDFVLGHDSTLGSDEVKYWTADRFNRLIQMKNYGLDIGRQNWAQFVLMMDSDVVLTNDNTFRSLTSNEDLIAMAPMLYSLGTYSNFWAGMTEKGYYERTDDYLPILERQRMGQFVVPMIHSCVYINLRHKKSLNLTFDSRDIGEYSPFDDIIAFAISAKVNKIDLIIDNNQVWGYIPPPIESSKAFDAMDQDVIDLQLESLVEGPEFPVSPSLVSYVSRPESDKLNVDRVYVINLVRRHKRRQRMLKCLELLGIEAIVWKAVDGKQLTEQYLKSKDMRTMDGYLDPYHKRPMTFGEIGCFLSHYYIWEEMIGQNLSKVIIFEDDVRFERNFKSRWRQALNKLDTSRYDLLYLGRKIQHPDNETQVDGLFVAPYYSYWTIGYMLTLNGAHKLMAANPLQNMVPVDEFLPIMYDKHPDQSLKQQFVARNLNALSVNPLLIYPTHYVGDTQYISDTEDSNKLRDETNSKSLHPKHTEL